MGGFFDNKILSLFSLDLFRQVASNDQMSVLKFNTFTTMLINAGIPFDVSYDSGNRKNTPGLELTIHINSTAALVLKIDLGSRSSTSENYE